MDTGPGLARRLGTTDAVAIGLGSMIGAGVFSAFAAAEAVAGAGCREGYWSGHVQHARWRLAQRGVRGWVSYIRRATTTPEAAVSAATAQMAVGTSKASAISPAASAPTANPPSRHSR